MCCSVRLKPMEVPQLTGVLFKISRFAMAACWRFCLCFAMFGCVGQSARLRLPCRQKSVSLRPLIYCGSRNHKLLTMCRQPAIRTPETALAIMVWLRIHYSTVKPSVPD